MLLVSTFTPRLAAALGAVALSLFLGTVEAGPGVSLRQPASVSYRTRDNCPGLCSVSGPNPANWTVYHNLGQVALCQETVFYHFSIHDPVDDGSTPHRIYACTSFGATKKPGVVLPAQKPSVQTLNNAPFTLGTWDEGARQGVDLRALSQQMRGLLANGFTANGNGSLVLFAQTVSSTAGLYMGKGLNVPSTASKALVAMETAIHASNITGGGLALQLCEDGYDGDHVFGFMATSNTSFTPVQQALRSWANATCLAFKSTQKVASTASFTTPLVLASNATINGTASHANATVWRSNRDSRLRRRGDCSTIQVVSGDGCGSLATKCGISGNAFTTYNQNPSGTLCSTLTPGQHVCCSAGTLPDFRPKPSADGSCATYTVLADDSCYSIAAANSITMDDLESYNKNTWAWNGCSLLWTGTVICLSSGAPPMPAIVQGTKCGPQMPGTTRPASGVDISSLNPCPLNACCDIWGQCGVTAEFCVNTSTGAPGTAARGTNGCISNCGTEVVQSSAPAEFISLAYFEGYGFGRPCLYQDVRQIDTSQVTHVHFAFGVLSAQYEVSTGDVFSTYEFEAFKQLRGVKRVLSFGGWDFSTSPNTYNIFRSGVTAANRMTMATNIANFIKANDLDGVDIDWEYPGEPDIPGIHADTADSAINYLEFLVILKNLLPGKTVSIAAPSSFWYLRAYPIAAISKVVDYIVFMTYDLHGQWDAGNKWSQDGCSSGMCLRSHINLTETMTALSMITKAGVPSNKVVVGVTSYGRSFAMADPNCHTANCLFTGTAAQSNAEEGLCTGVAGYIANAEINDILNNPSRVSQNYIDSTSNSRIVVYDNTQWVAFMDDGIRSERTKLYKGLSMGGTTNWAVDLETYHAAPASIASWDAFKSSIKIGYDPWAKGTRHGNWTTIDCSDESVANLGLTPEQRWDMMDAPDAWSDILSVYWQYDQPIGNSFTSSVSNTVHGPEMADCSRSDAGANCGQTLQCGTGFTGGGSGAAGYEIWNSLVIIHELYMVYHEALDEAGSALGLLMKDFEDRFAPVAPPPEDTWLDLLLSVVDLVGTVATASFFNSALKSMPYFKYHTQQYDNLKDTSKALVAFGVSVTETMLKSKTSDGGWTAESQDAFSAYMEQVKYGWQNATERSLKKLFDGTNSSISVLTSTIARGQLIEGYNHTYANVSADTDGDNPTLLGLQGNITKAFFGFAIPQIWNLSDARAFILDSGYDCSVANPEIDHLAADINRDQTSSCYDGKLYYLVSAGGKFNPCNPDPNCETHDCSGNTCSTSVFYAPPGLTSLDGSPDNIGGITVSDLITGAMNTYKANGNANGGAQTNPHNDGSLDDLMGADVTTPGFVVIPVCTADSAYAIWGDNTVDPSVPNWPCYVKPSPNDCEQSSFIDQTSDASPTVDDCMGLVNAIKGTQKQWPVYDNGGEQQGLYTYGSCTFGIQSTDLHGDIEFWVGAQDVVDLVTDSISKFGGSGKVGAKGYMDCRGNINSQDTMWGLY